MTLYAYSYPISSVGHLNHVVYADVITAGGMHE
jgi:hypothetical protein